MDEENKRIVVSNVVRFREELGKSQAELSRESGVDLERLRRIERASGEFPEVPTLRALARALGRPIFDFYLAPKSESGVRFRARKMNVRRRSAIVASCVRRLERFCFLEDELGLREEFSLPVGELLERGDPAEIANATRARLGIAPDAPIENVGAVLQKSGVKFWLCPTTRSEGVYGLAIARSPQATAAVVFTSEDVSVERQAFSAIHELGHLILHSRSFNSAVDGAVEEEERQADRFASYFLVPRDAFLKCWEKTRGRKLVERVLKIKKYFRVSYLTILRRLIDEGLAPQKSVYQEFSFQYKAGRYPGDLKNHKEPFPTNAFEAEDRFETLVLEALRQGIVSFSRAAEFLEISASELYEKRRPREEVATV